MFRVTRAFSEAEMAEGLKDGPSLGLCYLHTSRLEAHQRGPERCCFAAYAPHLHNQQGPGCGSDFLALRICFPFLIRFDLLMDLGEVRLCIVFCFLSLLCLLHFLQHVNVLLQVVQDDNETILECRNHSPGHGDGESDP